MKARTASKRAAQWRRPFYDGIARYNAKLHKCKRWRNRRKAQKQWQQSVNRYFHKMLARH